MQVKQLRKFYDLIHTAFEKMKQDEEYYRAFLKEICPHPKVIKLPAIVYDGVAMVYERRICAICKLEESADNNGNFNKLQTVDFEIINVNSSLAMAEFYEFREYKDSDLEISKC